MKPLFCRIGNKYPIVDKLLKYFPEHKIYVEPFVGSGALLFNKDKSDVEVINDLDDNLIEAYKLLKVVSDDPNKYNIQSGIENIQKFVDRPQTTNENKLLKHLYTMCNTFSSKGYGKIYRGKTLENKINKIGEYKDRIKDVKIFNQDYKTIINKYDSPNTFFFLDPPYEESGSLYKNSKFDYEELAGLLKNIKGYFMLTLNDSSNIRKLFKNFNIKGLTVKSRGGNVDIGGVDRKEVIIMNYKF